MAKYFLVVEEGYEYNDENYYKNESEAYTIESKLLKSKEEAQKIADQKNEESANNKRFVDEEGNPFRPYKVISVED